MNSFIGMLTFIFGLIISKLAGNTYQEALLLCCCYLLVGIFIVLLDIRDKMK